MVCNPCGENDDNRLGKLFSDTPISCKMHSRIKSKNWRIRNQLPSSQHSCGNPRLFVGESLRFKGAMFDSKLMQTMTIGRRACELEGRYICCWYLLIMYPFTSLSLYLGLRKKSTRFLQNAASFLRQLFGGVLCPQRSLLSTSLQSFATGCAMMGGGCGWVQVSRAKKNVKHLHTSWLRSTWSCWCP